MQAAAINTARSMLHSKLSAIAAPVACSGSLSQLWCSSCYSCSSKQLHLTHHLTLAFSSPSLTALSASSWRFVVATSSITCDLTRSHMHPAVRTMQSVTKLHYAALLPQLALLATTHQQT